MDRLKLLVKRSVKPVAVVVAIAGGGYLAYRVSGFGRGEASGVPSQGRLCRDGSVTFAGGQGACSWHGGVS